MTRHPITHTGFLTHANHRWAKRALALTLLAALAYALIDQQPRPNGGTALGYTLGTVAVLLILWLSAIGLRKRIITPGPYSLKAWTSAHVWLGLSLTIIATLHTGFQLGANIHGLSYVLMMIVIASGLWGVVAYTTLPAKLSANRGEATQPQMLAAIAALDAQLHAAAQPLGADAAALVRISLEDRKIGGGLAQRLTANYPECGTARARAQIQSLVDQQARTSKLDPNITQILFLLERKGAALAQARRHIAIKTRLELWLYLHVPLTFALLAALTAHILSVFLYW